jgi:CyaY protein
MTTHALTEQEFERAADRDLHALDDALGDLDGLEVSLQMGILAFEFPDGAKYIVNSHRAARQIWMAAEQSAWHFDYLPAEGANGANGASGRWIAAKNGDELVATVSAVLSRKLGREIHLAP